MSGAARTGGKGAKAPTLELPAERIETAAIWLNANRKGLHGPYVAELRERFKMDLSESMKTIARAKVLREKGGKP